MSELGVRSSDYELTKVVDQTPEIWLAKNLGKTKVTFTTTFPKSTHHQRLAETKYEEVSDLYELREALKSKGEMKAGMTIPVLQPAFAAYDETMAKRYHEEALSESPLVTVLKPKFPNISDLVVLFLEKSPAHPGTYVLHQGLLEGESAVGPVKQALTRGKKTK